MTGVGKGSKDGRGDGGEDDVDDEDGGVGAGRESLARKEVVEDDETEVREWKEGVDLAIALVINKH